MSESDNQLDDEARNRILFSSAMVGISSCESFSEILKDLEAQRELLLSATTESSRLANVWMLCRMDASYTRVWAISERLLQEIGHPLSDKLPDELSFTSEEVSYEEMVTRALDHLKARQRAFSEQREQMIKLIQGRVPTPTEEELASVWGASN